MKVNEALRQAYLKELRAQPISHYFLPGDPRCPKPKAKPSAEVLPWPKPLSEMELCRRQAIIDSYWQRTLDERAAQAREAARTCNRGPGDPDWDRQSERDPLGIWGRR